MMNYRLSVALILVTCSLMFAAPMFAAPPAPSYSTYFGGEVAENGVAVAVDNAGYIYLAGWTESITNFAVIHAFQPQLGGGRDAFVAKLSPDGQTVIYSSYLGGTGQDAVRAIAADDSGNVVLIGVARSTDFPTHAAMQASMGGGEADAFITKLDPTGKVIFSTYFGGQGNDIGGDVALDEAGQIYVIGQTTSTDLPVTSSAYQAKNAGGSDAFIAKLTSMGQLTYLTYFGGGQNDEGWSIALDNAHNVYITGLTGSSDLPMTQAMQPQFKGGETDAFLVKLQIDTKTLLYGTYLGGSGKEDMDNHALAVDKQGNMYLAGYTTSSDFPTVNALQPKFQGVQDCYVAKIATTVSTLNYITYLGGSDDDGCYSLALDGQGQVYVVGFTRSKNFPLVSAFQTGYGGGDFDIFISQFTADGQMLNFSSYLGGDLMDVGWGVALDKEDNAYIVGQSWSTNFPLTKPLQGIKWGSRNAILTKLMPRSNVTPVPTPIPTQVPIALSNPPETTWYIREMGLGILAMIIIVGGVVIWRNQSKPPLKLLDPQPVNVTNVTVETTVVNNPPAMPTEPIEKKQRTTGGAPPNIDNDWAWEQVNELGRKPAEVYPEWKEHREQSGTFDHLSDPTESFRKAIAKNRKTKK